MTNDENIRLIPLTQGQFAVVDAEDFEWLNQRKWSVRRVERKGGITVFYVITRNGRGWLRMHNALLKIDPPFIVDHINGNPLDNRKSNLRAITQSQNCMNRRPTKRLMTSQYKGVFKIREDRWRAKIRANHKQIHIGYFKTEVAAAKAYDESALKFYGEFACLNFPIMEKINGG